MIEYQSKEYYERRAAKARQLVVAAADPAMRAIHLEMANGYVIRVEDAAGTATRFGK